MKYLTNLTQIYKIYFTKVPTSYHCLNTYNIFVIINTLFAINLSKQVGYTVKLVHLYYFGCVTFVNNNRKGVTRH